VSPDPWTAFLDWLETVIVPNWTELITMLPLFLAIGVTGPILSLVAAYWLWHRFKRRSGRVKVALPAPIAAQLAFHARKPVLLASAALLALAPIPAWWFLQGAVDALNTRVAVVKAREVELGARRGELIALREKSVALAATNAQLGSVVLNRDHWNDFLVELQAQVLSSRHQWVEELRVRRDRPAPAAPAEGEAPPPPPAVVTKVPLSVRLLLEEVSPGKDAVINSEVFRRRQRELIDALRKNSFVESIHDGEIRADTSQPNLPRLSLTLVIKPDKTL